MRTYAQHPVAKAPRGTHSESAFRRTAAPQPLNTHAPAAGLGHGLEDMAADRVQQRLERALRFGYNFASLPVHAPDRQTSAPAQPRSAGLPDSAPVQLMPRWKRRLAQAGKWIGGAAAIGGGIALATATAPVLGAAALGLGGLAAVTGHRVLSGETAEDRLQRWNERGAARKANDRFETGTYDHPVGPVSISGVNRQRMSLTNQANYGGETLGRMPEYSQMGRHLNYPGAEAAIYDPEFSPANLTQRQRMATVLAASASNVSEPDKAPGIDKAIRSFARQHTAEPTRPHPLDPAINPAVSSADEARAFVSGDTGLTEDQRHAIDSYASDSSDEEAEPYVRRKGMLKRRQ